VFSYLKTFSKARVIIKTSYHKHSVNLVEYQAHWLELYQDIEEEITKDILPEKWPRVRMTVYEDTEQANDLVTSQESLLY
jgi:hypothetical protein